ncbi:Protein Gawky, partial [Orchesella cincta]
GCGINLNHHHNSRHMQSQWGGGGPGPGPVAQQGHANMGMGIGGGHGAQHGLKDNIGNKQVGGSGWDDVSPPTQRRPVPNIPNYDDGTSLWGSPIAAQQQPQQPQPRGMPPNRGMPNKMDMGWGGHGGQTRNGGWQNPEGPQDGGFNPGGGGGGGGGGGWNDDNNKAIGSWSEPQMSQNNSWNKPKTPTNPNPGWGDDGLVDVSNWGVPPKPTGSRYHNGNANGSTAKDLLWSSIKPYNKLLADLGCKKEDLEQLNFRSSNINLNDAMDHLDPLAPGGVGVGGRGPMDGPWGGGGGAGPLGPQRRGPPPPVEDHFDLGGLGVGPGPMGMGPPPQPRGGFPPNPSGFSGANSIMNNVGNPGAALNQGLLARLLNSQQPNNQPQFNPQGRVPANSLQLLVQQIRMAVQAGYLSSQILSHPLPQQSLYLLNQLLQQIKVFHQLTETQRQIGKSNSNAALQLSVQITKTKQAIANLHNQIAAQQALHAKQQQQQQPHHPLANAGGPGNPPNNDFFKAPPVLGDNRGVGNSGSSMMDPFMALPNNFGSDVGIKESNQHQQSKLGQWTKSVEKDDSNPVPEFSRAPGQQSNNSSNLLKNNPSLILGQSDNTWSSAASRSGGDGWPTDHSSSSQNVNNSALNQGDDSSKSGSNVNMNPEAWPADLVPEFEPGKPWKGTQMIKNVDDDPTLTPGSVVRSPLSLAAIKDDFLQKNSTSTMSSMQNDSLANPLISLQSSNPWSFTPTSSGSTSIANSLAKQLNPKWDDMGRRDLWDYNNSAGGAPGSRPPPGLPKKAPGPNTSVPSASGNVTSGTNSSTFNSFRNNSTNSWGGPNPGGAGGLGNSHSWLLLRNLTPQIDGSTLKTLCCQHGPLQKFHLYTSHGVALVRYSSSEEAGKAQRALNNCLLGNTTILAETAGDDVHNIIQGFNSAVNQPSSAPTNSGFSSGNNSNDNPWGVIRDNSPLWSSNPWGSSGLDGPDRATPSSLNSLLPGDLLGGESA